MDSYRFIFLENIRDQLTKPLPLLPVIIKLDIIFLVPSSVISGIKYDPSTSVLRVTFVSRMVYEYKSVPEQVYLRLKTAGSKGKYLNTHIKGTYPFNKVNADSINKKAS